MPANDQDDRYAVEVIRTVSELTKRTESMSRQIDQSTKHADEEREKLRQYVDQAITSFRKDVNRTTAAIQVRAVEHDQQHGADRIERVKRQWVLDAWLILLTLLGIANIVLASYLIGRG